MRPFFYALISCITALGIPASRPAEERAKPKEEVICDKQYKIVAPNDPTKELGRYHIKGTYLEDGKQVRILEEMTMDYARKKVAYKSTVIYNTTPSLGPAKGSAETTVNGKPCMKGTVELKDKALSSSCLGLLNWKTGERIDPPKHYEKKIKKPKGILVFQSALPVLGPRLIREHGELKNVVFVEFPDDVAAPELITCKEGYRLVRGKPNAAGQYVIKIFSPRLDTPVSEVQFDRSDKLASISAFGKLALVEMQPTSRPQ